MTIYWFIAYFLIPFVLCCDPGISICYRRQCTPDANCHLQYLEYLLTTDLSWVKVFMLRDWKKKKKKASTIHMWAFFFFLLHCIMGFNWFRNWWSDWGKVILEPHEETDNHAYCDWLLLIMRHYRVMYLVMSLKPRPCWLTKHQT